MSTFAMDKESLSQTWVGNMYLRLEAVCQEFDEFINQDPVKYVENHIQTVGESMKKFYDGVIQDLILPPSIEAYTNSVAAIKENTIDNNTSIPEEGLSIPTEKCYKMSPTCEISESPVEEADNNPNLEHEDDDLINKTSFQEGEILYNTNSESDDSVFEDADWGIKDIIDLNLEIEKKIEEELLVKESYEKDLMETLVSYEGQILYNTNSVFEDADWGIGNIIDLNLEIEKKIEEEPLVEENYDKVLMETSVSDEFVCDSNTSSKLECLITCNGNKEEKAKSIDSSSMGDYFSASSYDISSCKSSTSHDHDNNNFSTRFSSSGFSLYSETTDELDSFMVDFEDLNIETINLSDKNELGESCVIVEGEKVFSFPYESGKSKSYKNIIQDAFMSRNKLTKEYKQLAIWCEDIDKKLNRKAHGNATNSQVQDSPDSEWELL